MVNMLYNVILKFGDSVVPGAFVYYSILDSLVSYDTVAFLIKEKKD